MIPVDLDALAAAALSWLLTYAIHSTILCGAALAIAARFADEHGWLDLVWKTALLGPIVTASVQLSADVRPLAGRWPIATPSVPARAAPAAPELKFRPAYDAQAVSAAPELKFRSPNDTALPSAQTVRRAELQFRPTVAALAAQSADAWPLLAVATWLALGAAGLTRLGMRFLRLHRLLRSGPPVSSAHLRQVMETLSHAVGARVPIRLTTSDICTVPLALAGRQVVLPERFLEQLDADQQQAALAHEVAHVARHDPAWRLLAGAIERAFFFQPLNRVARTRLCESAEFLCDQWAVRQTQSALALARCLSAVAAWASAEQDHVWAGASPMARSDSPLIRRVTRILTDVPPDGRRPSGAWLAAALVGVALAAPLVTAAQIGDPGASAPIDDRATGTAPAPADGEQTHKDLPPRVWTPAETAQARARLRVTTAPSGPLGQRWQWALDTAARQGGGFWVVYSFQTPIHADDIMMTDTKEGSFVSNKGHLMSDGPPLSDLLVGSSSSSASGNVFVLLHYGAARAEAVDRAAYRSARLGFDFGSTPVYSLGLAPETESFARVRELFGQSRRQSIKVFAIELASLHPTTDLVLPFLTGLVDASNPLEIRREAAEGFDHHHDPRSVEILMRVARTDAASEVRAEAAETIGEVQTPQSVPALTDLATNSPDPAVRREAAEAFADQPPDLALPAIERLVATSVDDDALGEAIEALGEIKDARVLPLLVKTATGHSSQRARQEAVETLGEVEEPGADAALTRIVWEQKDETIQREAVETLGDRTPVATAELERIVRDHPVAGVRAEAIETIADVASGISDVATLDGIQQAIEHAIFRDADRQVQHEAVDALEELPRDRAERVLHSVIDRHPDADLRDQAKEQLQDRPKSASRKDK